VAEDTSEEEIGMKDSERTEGLMMTSTKDKREGSSQDMNTTIMKIIEEFKATETERISTSKSNASNIIKTLDLNTLKKGDLPEDTMMTQILRKEEEEVSEVATER
jgi:hypothetical protein